MGTFKKSLATQRLLTLAVGVLAVSPVALAGGDDCAGAPVTTVPVGAPGSPLPTIINGDNSGATGPGADCLAGGSDLGWFEAFEIDRCAKVTIDFCDTDPVSRPLYTLLYRSCPCTASIGVNDFDRFGHCPNYNGWMQFDELPAGRYWYPIYTVPGDKRCENGNPVFCTSSAQCPPPYTCQDNLHPYVLRITAEEIPTATVAAGFPAQTLSTNEAVTVAAGPSTGPDLIVGHIFGCTGLGREGPVGSGTIGMSCATTACTIGDEGTDWYGLPDVNHPMISVNLFRLSTQNGSDRLMQLGQSWLKHGFGTENANNCGLGCDPRCLGGPQAGQPCTSNGECPLSSCEGHFNLNAPNCSDTYVASQFVPCDLGPRSMINPYTGVMPTGPDLGPSPGCVPLGRETESRPANNHLGHVHNQISHRLQVQEVDLIPALNPGALYFAEGQYITPHEFVAGNGTQNNNVSHRQVTVAGDIACGGLFFVETSDTFAEQPAINAWPGAPQSLIEPAPLVDGRGFLVYKVTDLGGNSWHYEYALYNMNLDRAMGSLRIPVVAGVTLSNVGFYAPLNHAPEPNTVNYDNDPWNVSMSGGEIRWATDDFASDPFANAVRFGTVYNFWFDADAAPQQTMATIGLFKTGGAVDVPVLGLGPPPPSAPPNCVWDSAVQHTRSLTFRTQDPSTATGVAGTAAIKVTMVDLEDPVPPNNNPVGPCCPPGNFTTFDTALNAVCAGGNDQGYRCPPSTCPGSSCPPGVGCSEPAGPNAQGSCARWVGPPLGYLESNDSPNLGNYRASRLQCAPYYHNWIAEPTGGLVNVLGAEFVPSSTYEIRSYGSTCKGMEDTCANVSDPVIVTTRRAGDISTPFQGGPPLTQPNAIDVTNAVNKFRNLAGSPPKAVAQVQPNVPDPNADINAIDIVTVVDNQRGFGYTYSGPCVCPSTVPCNTTACAGASACTGLYGAGAACIKTCTSGPRLGQPCNNNLNCGACIGGPASGNGAAGIPCDANSDCVSNNCGVGVCPTGATPGFCRDRCGRCN
jgi:hypothetical protein